MSHLNNIIRIQGEAERLRRWLADVEFRSGNNAGGDFARMVVWARWHLTFLEASVDHRRIDEYLKNRRLFPEIDELYDPEGDPPDDPYYW